MTLLLNIDVSSLEEGEQFYTSAFNLRVGRRFADNALELLGWPIPLYLLKKAGGTTGAALEQRRYERHWTPLHVDVVVADLDSALGRALAAGASLETGPADVRYGRIAMLADPFGHGLCLIEFNPMGYDAMSAA